MAMTTLPKPFRLPPFPVLKALFEVRRAMQARDVVEALAEKKDTPLKDRTMLWNRRVTADLHVTERMVDLRRALAKWAQDGVKEVPT
jgi:hypothetical protein